MMTNPYANNDVTYQVLLSVGVHLTGRFDLIQTVDEASGFWTLVADEHGNHCYDINPAHIVSVRPEPRPNE